MKLKHVYWFIAVVLVLKLLDYVVPGPNFYDRKYLTEVRNISAAKNNLEFFGKYLIAQSRDYHGDIIRESLPDFYYKYLVKADPEVVFTNNKCNPFPIMLQDCSVLNGTYDWVTEAAKTADCADEPMIWYNFKLRNQIRSFVVTRNGNLKEL